MQFSDFFLFFFDTKIFPNLLGFSYIVNKYLTFYGFIMIYSSKDEVYDFLTRCPPSFPCDDLNIGI